MRFLYLIFIVELFVGGGGRLISFGPITARMILFCACIIFYILISLNNQKEPGFKLASALVGLFFLTHFHALVIGYLNVQNADIAVSEFQQGIFWICSPFIAYILRDQYMIEQTAKILIRCAIFLSAIYVCLIALIFVGILDPIIFYEAAGESGEFFFRTDSLFFYKGFIYIAIGIMFAVALQIRNWQYWSLFLTLALILTLTRGFLLSTSIAIILMIVSQRRWKLLFMIVFIVGLSSLLILEYFPSADTSLETNRLNSSNQRLDDMNFIFSNIDISTFLFGQGYGSVINERLYIENTFLWALWKIGIFGVLFWLIPLFLCTLFYIKIRKFGQNKMAAAYYFGVILIYIQTLTNPYLNNPIGLSFVIISIFSLHKIYRGMYSRELI